MSALEVNLVLVFSASSPHQSVPQTFPFLSKRLLLLIFCQMKVMVTDPLDAVTPACFVFGWFLFLQYLLLFLPANFMWQDEPTQGYT